VHVTCMFSVYCLPVAYYERSGYCILRSDVARSSRHGPKGRDGLYNIYRITLSVIIHTVVQSAGYNRVYSQLFRL